MTLRITEDLLRSTYDMLNCCGPFTEWNLPDGEDVRFIVSRSREHYGQYGLWGGKHFIEVSSAKCGHLTTVIYTVAHEMCHLTIEEQGLRDSAKHGPAFRKLAARVSAHLGFDPKMF